MKYPYIGELTQNDTFCSIALFAGKDFGALLKRTENEFDLYEFEDDYNERDFKNITRKYLANTYGKVDSKEHADFIVELAEGAGFVKHSRLTDGEFFFISDTRYGFGSEKFCSSCAKQITIPLPPKQDDSDEWPKVGSKVTWGEREIIGTVKCIDNWWAWILCPDGKYTQQGVKYLKPPKTPEEELREFLELLWRENNHDFSDFLDIAMKHIKKKPQ